MAQSDWNFNGELTNTSTSRRGGYVSKEAGVANGGASATSNGAYASLWEGTLNSSLTSGGGVLPVGAGGDYCRSAIYSNDAGSYIYEMGWSGMNLLKTSAGGSDYPVTAPAGPSDLWAYSLRAFLRIGCLSGEQDNGTPGDSGCGTYVGLQAKCVGGSSDFNTSVLGNRDNQSWWYGMATGYGVWLSSSNHITLDGTYWGTDETGYGSPGGNDIRLIILAGKEEDAYDGTPTNHKAHNCTIGTYENNTWYHVRMDVLAGVGGDTINVYTAPITDVVGSETWTLVGSMNVDIGDPYYTPWDNADSDQVGWIWGVRTNISGATQKMSDAYIDRFQFFTKDIS